MLEDLRREKVVPPGAADDAGYFSRKFRELALIEGACTRAPSTSTIDGDLSSLMKRKFQSAALCRAQTAAAQWAHTETGWGGGSCESGAFDFEYEYQRADLSVAGPPPYPRAPFTSSRPVHYTASGMAALSAALLAMRRLWPGCRFDGRQDGYPETQELIALLGEAAPGASRIALLDSTVDTAFEAERRLPGASAALFDTSCFAASSGRISAIGAKARAQGVPLVLVRSHTKLDCLGLEYGRLGSVVVAEGADTCAERIIHCLTADFIRLTGAGALPMHFPPFAAGKEYQALLRSRTAWTIRCCRFLARRLQGKANVRRYAHGLYLVFYPRHFKHKDEASDAAASLVSAMTAAQIPARHAGSFGFDFFACDWFEDPVSGDLGIRLSVGDLPFDAVMRAASVLETWFGEAAG